MATRKYIDCREHTNKENKCTVSISADNEDELIKAEIQHAVGTHGVKYKPELRDEIKSMIKEI